MNTDEEGKIEMSLRILGNEIIGFKMVVDDFKMKWLLLGIISLAVLSFIMVQFGPEIMETFS
jgi:hypothetical protein|tara:strand:- start:1149 stop:1334 length:186 start_codon:yes stop_codon:yes gene_type:complete